MTTSNYGLLQHQHLFIISKLHLEKEPSPLSKQLSTSYMLILLEEGNSDGLFYLGFCFHELRDLGSVSVVIKGSGKL